MQRGQPPDRMNMLQGMAALRILVAEDNAANAMVVSGYLGLFGHHAVVVKTGHEVVDLAAQQSFDLILMDLQMPGMDGLTATAKIRSLPDKARSDIPIVALTADITRETQTAALAAGMNDILHKPLSSERLRMAIQNIVCPQSDPQLGATSAPAPVPVATDILDQEATTRMIADLGHAQVEALRDKAQSTFGEMMVALRTQLAATDLDHREILKIAHKMAGTTSSAGLMLLSDSVRQLEGKMLSGESMAQIVQHCVQIDVLAQRSFAVLTAAINASASKNTD